MKTTKISARRAPSALSLRIDCSNGARIGPGKIALLETLAREGSISAAARELGMSYRRAWLLLDATNRMFDKRVAQTFPGRAQGGAELTAFGVQLVALYRAMERDARTAIAPSLRKIDAALARDANELGAHT